MSLFDLLSEPVLPTGCYAEGDKPTADEIFVFGSNLAGRHGLGAAKVARELYGAIYGQGIGLQGRSYAIPTKDRYIKTLPLLDIRHSARIFVEFSKDNPRLKFFISRFGCMLAGYTDEEIAPMLNGIGDNCRIHVRWERFVKRS